MNDIRKIPGWAFCLNLPRWQWIFAVIAALIIVSVGAWVGGRIYQQRVAIREIARFNGSVDFHQRGPEWLRGWVGEKRMEWFDEPEHIVFWSDEATFRRRSRRGGVIVKTTGPTIDDAGLICVLGLPNLKSLDLAFSNISDSGIDHVSRLQNLENLRLEGSDVSDLSIRRLSQMRSLKELNVEHTWITNSGGRKLAAALPGCDVRGPHNDKWLLRLGQGAARMSLGSMRERKKKEPSGSP